MTLVEFLRARLDEDERAANAEARGWETGSRYEGQPLAWVQHVQRWPVDRVLAEVDAKRRIMELAFEHASNIDGHVGCCHFPEDIAAGECSRQRPDDLELLRLLALPYADHPDYDESWRP